ncbi:MAG: hypothetical protein AABX23_05175 [Nanoarchaeota archaeon]
MKKALTSLLFAGALTTSCTPYLHNINFIHDSEIVSVSNRDYQERIPTITHSGLELVTMVSRNRQGTELPFMGIPYGTPDSWEVKNRRARTIDIDSDVVYILPKFEIPEEVTDEKGVKSSRLIFAKEVEFKTTGKYAIIARKKGSPKPNTNEQLGVRIITNKEWEYVIPAIEIDHDNKIETPKIAFFAPIVTDDNDVITERLMIPVEGFIDETQERINSKDGRIVIRSNEIYALRGISSAEYNARNPENSSAIIPNVTPNQGSVIVR